MALKPEQAVRGENWSPRLKAFKKLFFLCNECQTNELRVGNSPSRLKSASGLCQSCAALKVNGKRPFEALYNYLKRQSHYRRPQVSVELTYDEFLAFTSTTSCHYCEIEIRWKAHGNSGHNLDRKDNRIGYSSSNCVVCCGSCNAIKSNRFTYAEMMLLAPVLRQIQIGLV